MRKFICIIALLCSIFVSQAQLIVPVGKTFKSTEVFIQRINPVTDQFEPAETFPLVQEFVFVAKDSLIVKYDNEIIVNIKFVCPLPDKKTEKMEIYYFTITRTFEGESVQQMIGIYVDRLGKVKGVAVGDEKKISFFFFESLITTNN